MSRLIELRFATDREMDREP